MSSPPWGEIVRRVEEEREAAALVRSPERVRRTAEVFTPSTLVVEVLRHMPVDVFGPGCAVLDPACGDGQFLSGAKWLKALHFGMSEELATAELFGVDIMEDNVKLCRTRLRGGTIVIGDVLHPHRVLPGQTDEDRRGLMRILGEQADQQLAMFAAAHTRSL